MAKIISVKYSVDTEDAVKSTDNLTDATDDGSKAQEQLQKELEQTSKGSKSASKGFKGVGTSLGSLAKGAGIITLIAGALGVLQEAFSNNQKVVDAFDTATTALGIAFNDFFNFLTENTGAITGFFKRIFEDPQQALKDFGEAIKQNLINRFNALIETFGLLGKAVKQVFEGDFAGAMETAKEASKTYVDILTGIPNTVDKVIQGTKDLTDAVINYTTSTINQASAIIQTKNSMVQLENQQVRLREEFDRAAEQQRQIRDDLRKSFAERIEANENLNLILAKQLELEEANINGRIANIQREQSALGVTVERANEIFVLETELAAVRATNAGFRSEQLINEEALLREQKQVLTELSLLGKSERDKAEAQAIADHEANITRINLTAQTELEQNVLRLQNDRELKNQLAAIDEQYTQKVEENADGRTAAWLKSNKAQIDGANQLLAASGFIFGTLAELAGENFENQKAFRIAEATIDTIAGAIAAFTGAMSLGPIAGPILGGALAAAVTTFGALNIAKISQEQPDGTSSSVATSIPSISIPTEQAPDAPQIITDQFAGVGIIQDVPPARAFVLSSDISSEQEANRKLERRAVLG